MRMELSNEPETCEIYKTIRPRRDGTGLTGRICDRLAEQSVPVGTGPCEVPRDMGLKTEQSVPVGTGQDARIREMSDDRTIRPRRDGTSGASAGT